MARTAATAYADYKSELEDAIVMLQEKLMRHESEFEKSGSADWGYVGDVEHIKNQIKPLAVNLFYGDDKNDS